MQSLATASLQPATIQRPLTGRRRLQTRCDGHFQQGRPEQNGRAQWQGVPSAQAAQQQTQVGLAGAKGLGLSVKRAPARLKAETADHLAVCFACAADGATQCANPAGDAQQVIEVSDARLRSPTADSWGEPADSRLAAVCCYRMRVLIQHIKQP
jgi:hypothetical protein